MSVIDSFLSNLNGPVILQTTSTALGLMICSTMGRVLIQPVAFAETFGLPLHPQASTTSQKENPPAGSTLKQNPWLVPLGARNGMLGVSILVFNYLGMTKATGVVMTVGTVLMGIGDVFATSQYGTKAGVITHLIGAGMFGAVGAGLLWVTTD